MPIRRAPSSITKTDDQAAEDPPAEGVWVQALHRGLDVILWSGVSAPRGIVPGFHRGTVVAAPGAGSSSYRNLEEADPLAFLAKIHIILPFRVVSSVGRAADS